MSDEVLLYHGEELAGYSFGQAHPFGPARLGAFRDEAKRRGLDRRCRIQAPVPASRELLERFHTSAYIEQLRQQSASGTGFLDDGDTPAFKGVYEAAALVAGSGVDATRRLMRGEGRAAFVPIAGLHHARRDAAAGFCAINDCGIVIESLFVEFGLERVAYVDIDAHHGDGVFYAFESEPRLVFADIHEDGRFLYPGTGAVEETGKGPAIGRKLNIPAPPDAEDDFFMRAWPLVERHLSDFEPQFVILQCGADSLGGDPITHLRFSSASHRHAATRLGQMSRDGDQGGLLVLGGGGYNLGNIAQAWCAVLEALL